MNQLALAVLTTMSMAKVIKREPGSGNGTIDAHVDVVKSNFNGDGKSSVSDKTFTLETKTSNSNKQLEIRSRTNGHGGRFILNVQGIPFIRAGTWNKHGDDFDGQSFRVALLRLSEVLAANETAVTSKNFIRLVGQQWSDIKVDSSVVAGVTITQFSTSVVVRGCNITLKGMISDQAAQTTSGNMTTVVTPLRFKYGIEVDNFPFQHGGSVQLVKSIRSRQADLHKDNNTMSTDAGTFEWTGDVVVDGKTVAVTSAKLDLDTSIVSSNDNSGKEDSHQDNDGGSENLVAFNLGAGASIYWDPSLNLEAQSAQQSSSANSLAMGITAVVGALLLF